MISSGLMLPHSTCWKQLIDLMPPRQTTGRVAPCFSSVDEGFGKLRRRKTRQYFSAERVLCPRSWESILFPRKVGESRLSQRLKACLRQARPVFFATDDIESVYAVDDPAGGRIRVIFDDTQQEVLRRIQRVRHLGGQSKAEVMRDPSAVFDGFRCDGVCVWATRHRSR